MEEAVEKFEALQRYIPVLEGLMRKLKTQADRKEDFAKKYEKLAALHSILSGGFKR